MRVSVICTVLNEGQAIRRLLDSLANQTYQPDEVVIVDGGSRDNTTAVIREYGHRLPLRVLVEPGANISRGRNVAIAAATSDVIASVDAGVWLEPQWLEELIAPLTSPGQMQVTNPESQIANRKSQISSPSTPLRTGPQTVAGFFVPDPQTTFEIAMGATVLPSVAEINPQTFLPSSRSAAFTKAAWVAAGGYPEWLDFCEDLVFDLRLQRAVGPFAWAPRAVAHFRPRGTLAAFFRQYYRYARGDGKADLWRKRHAVRYLTYLILLPGLVVLSSVHTPLWLLALLVGALAYCRTPYRRLAAYWPRLSAADRLRSVLLVPVIRGVGDLAKMVGYPVGWVWRLRNWRRPEVHWRRSV